ncbi:fatty acid synthase-like [Macrosteles quadrilineatus]|uniref:fatty acid synthase-like n=1 Tax=Macrosteles quadrilineatus TaxID=74068 RepID=UPI0023E26086|nr:fatty acid synthase-like [Macrosteles quadrilineatus]
MDSEQHEVVISGISGRFPECFSVDDLQEKLLTKSVLIKPDEDRLLYKGFQNIHLASGKIPEWNRFDNTLFGVSKSLVNNADPLLGMILERSFEAILDAGVSPFTLKGHKIGVYVSPSPSDNETLRLSEMVFCEGAGMVGNSRAMMANRISYCFSFTGPSVYTDSSWVSGITVLKKAVSMVSSGLVEAALIATASNLLHTIIDCEYNSLGLLSSDGVCRPFDANADGFVRSEATVAFYIQRKRDAKRSYGTVRKAHSLYMGLEPCSLLEINPYMETFLKNFYDDGAINIEDVGYIEAHGMSNKEYDSRELNALANLLCNKKKTTQLIGSITGNVGHCDNCTGFVALAKVASVLNSGIIPPTVNYNNPNTEVPALVSGKLKAVTETTDLSGDLVAINTMSAFGHVGHAVLQRHERAKKNILAPEELPPDGLYRLVTLQARNEQGAKTVCEKVAAMPLDVEYVSLVNEAFNSPIPAYLWRGYSILPTVKDRPVVKYQQIDSATKRPLWFIFSGMGSQWAGMGKELMKIPEFASSIIRCDKVLRPKGLDIVDILSSDVATTFDNILNCFVGITAVQIGLVDVMTKLEIIPDGIIGHSVGELGCAYADGCFTAEETILAAYARGKASLDSLADGYVKGIMAAVGLGYNEIKDKLPPTIDVACHNSATSCTISGPTEDVNTFVEKLNAEGVFARTVSAGGIAYHSRYIKPIAPKLLKALKETVPNPKPRSSKWICTSAPQSQWNTETVKMCSPEYHTNNLLNPVYFEEGCAHLPDNAILVEIAPHGLLQAILRRSISPNSLTLSTTSRTVESNLVHLLKCVGELYLSGVSMNINALFPKVEYPVARGTPSISTLATWDHEEEFYGELSDIIKMNARKGLYEYEIRLHPTVPEYRIWNDHRMAGKVVVPISQMLIYPLQMLLALKQLQAENQFTIIEDITVAGSNTVDELEKKLLCTCSPTSKKFMVSEMSPFNVYMSGQLMECDKPQPIQVPEVKDVSAMEEISESDVYIMLSELGCDLGPLFQNIKKLYIGSKECVAKVRWSGNVITFLDALMKIIVLFKSREHGSLLLPQSFTKIVIDGPFLMSTPPDTELQVYYKSSSNRLVCQGAEIYGTSLSPAAINDTPSLSWSELKFQPYFDEKVLAEDFLSSSVHTAAEDGFNAWKDDSCTITVLVLQTDDDSSSQYTQLLKSKFNYRPNIQLKILQVDQETAKEQVKSSGRSSIIVVGEYNIISNLVKQSGESGNVYLITHLNNNGSPKYDQSLKLILVHQTESGKLALLKKAPTQTKLQVYKAETSGWLNDLRNIVKKEVNALPIVVVTQSLTPTQVLPALSKEPFAYRIRTVFIEDRHAQQFAITNSFYSTQLSYGLSVNILSGGSWGSLRYISQKIHPCNYNMNSLVKSPIEHLQINCLGLNTPYFTYHPRSSNEETGLRFVDYSGVLKGQRVMGVASLDPEANILTPDPILMWSVPADWTLEDAATTPVAYTMAYICVIEKAKVYQGEHVLVHAGCSPLGQAVISVALQAGAKVLVSVKNEQEIKLLTDRFPTIKDRDVFVLNKEDINVAVRKRIGGKGVEVIVSCLRGNDFQSTVKVADVDCRIIHLSEIRVEDREIIGLYNFFQNRSIFGVSLNSIDTFNDESKIDLQKMLKDGISQGVVMPLKKRLFQIKDLTDALGNLQINNATEKTVLISKLENQVMPVNGYFMSNLDSVHIIAGPNVELKFELAEWLIHHGASKLVVLNDEGLYLKRVNRILYRKKCSTMISSSACLDTPEGALKFLKETLHIGMVSSIFCVSMDENGSKMKNLDLACRELLPQLQHFVSLLGKGSEVSDSRSISGLPTCCIKSGSPVEAGNKVIPYLFRLLADTQTTAKFYLVSDHLNTTKSKGTKTSLAHLPNSVEELYNLGMSLESQETFVEETTLSPKYSASKYSTQPVFVFPGLGSHFVRPLLRQIMHPAFCCRLPTEAHSLHEVAESMVQDIHRIKPQGPYTIIGESWGGAYALAVSQLLQSEGYQVKLILIQGVPTIEQHKLRDLCRRSDADLGNCILNVALHTEEKNYKNWKERLTQLLQTLEPDVRDHVARGVTSLNHQLTSFLNYEPSKVPIIGMVDNVICNKNDLLNYLDHLSRFCQDPPNIKVADYLTHSQLLVSQTTASVINENVVHSWKK